MKARIKHTEKIIDVEWTMYGWVWDGPEGRRGFDLEELIFLDNDNFDWQSFRAEAAKDFVSIICNHRYDVKEERYQVICKEAIALADELIKQLKEKREK